LLTIFGITSVALQAHHFYLLNRWVGNNSYV
jgi:hypothetical protein